MLPMVAACVPRSTILPFSPRRDECLSYTLRGYKLTINMNPPRVYEVAL